MVFTPDGKYLLAAARAAGWNYDTAFRVWHVPTGELKQALGGWNMQTVAVHPRGNIMVVADNTWWYIKAIRLWQAFTPDDSRQQTGSAVFKGKFGYTYRFYALGEDKVGNRMAMPAEPQATTTAGVAPELSAGLRLIALPVVSEEPNAQRVLGFEADKLAVYEPASGYVRYPNVALQVGRGYWVQLPAAQRPNIRGDVPDESQPFTIPLQQGWNLIGNPWLESLSWNLSALQVSLGGQTKSLAEARAAGWLEDYAWTWDGSKYVLIYDNSIVPGVISQLEAWQGCWVYAHQACNLILPAPGETTRQFQVIAEPESGVGLKITGVTATRTRGGAFHITFHLTAPAANQSRS